MTVAEATRTGRVDRKSEPRAFLPEVQALRAVAVLLVVVYHIYPGKLPGGFVGVDVFFAISGFLITSHLLSSLLTRGTIRISRFWANRIWRLLPASLFVLAACWIFTLLYTPVTVASDTFKQIGAASAYVENWVLAIDSVDYLARDNAPTIVQHYWSLSVEEQFYILWPLLLISTALVVGKLAARRSGSTDAARVRGLWIVMIAVAVGSFIFSVVETRLLPAHAYFDTFTRAWEFAAGGLLALVIVTFRDRIETFRGHRLVGFAGLPFIAGMALIFASGLLMNSSTPFPSGWAGIPVVGTLLVIAGGLPRARPFAVAVQWRPVQFFGDISYSLYLWHWPLIIGFAIVVERRHTTVEGLVILAVAIGLAWLTKITIEDPIRRVGRRAKPVWPSFLLAALGATILISASLFVVNDRAQAAAAAEAERAAAITDESGCVGANATLGTSDCADPFQPTAGSNPVLPYKDLDKDWCLTWFDEDWRTCTFGDTAGTNGTMAIVGDSHAAALTNPLGEYLRERGWKLVTFTRFGCPGLSPTPIGLRAQTPEMEAACAEWSARVTDEISSRTDIDTVLYTSYESAYATPAYPGAVQLTSDDIIQTLGRVADSGKNVILLHDFPRTSGTDVPTCIAQTHDPMADCSVALADGYPPVPHSVAAEKLGGRIRTVDSRAALCDSDRCYQLVGDVVAYADDNHISESFARSLMPYLGPAILDGAPLEPTAGKGQ
ncbi:acyltransferase [Microbacterium jejuense]|uniref:Acyltransferase n=1 Tax=Microbacterium jejuense TaxID=1263637 RepID=A0ABS7HNR1_9MICO|nr:acyltransferase family protein [Microbacterium jejuense]MBW9094609.1 acyltransferase [Microbacterium jejuense]